MIYELLRCPATYAILQPFAIRFMLISLLNRLLHASHSRNLTTPRNPLIFCVAAVNCYFLGVVWVTKAYIELHASMHR